jgi:XTP/dITP diphosphohydrolase
MKLFLATGNLHKVEELTAMIGASGLSVEVLPASAIGGMPDVEEDGTTFAANARKKALALAGALPAGALAVADDSGLCVDALDGAPGVRSARFAGKGANDAANTAKLMELLRGMPETSRRAAFHCAIAVARRDGVARVFEGRCPGRIIDARRGAGGFGYDPVFVPDGYELTFAELSAEVKNRISHRARALAAFVAWLRSSGAGDSR